MSLGPAVPRFLVPAIISLALFSSRSALHAQGCHTAHNPAALKTLQEKAAAGDADAQCGLGRQYEFALGVPQDDRQAAFWLQKSAEQGDILAQVELGVVFDRSQDYAAALVWYRKAADEGNARAEYNLALAYEDGEGVPKDEAQAIEWYRKAADQGDALAQVNLGVAYEHGEGVPQDYSQAVDWYRKAAEQGLAEAQYGLGFLYLHGNGVPKDETQATMWLLKAAEQGEAKAQFNLGACYVNGAGVSRNVDEGYFWIALAGMLTTDQDLKQQAEESLGALTQVMSKRDIKNAQKRAGEWLNKHAAKTGR